jgi:hypothetical protein
MIKLLQDWKSNSLSNADLHNILTCCGKIVIPIHSPFPRKIFLRSEISNFIKQPSCKENPGALQLLSGHAVLDPQSSEGGIMNDAAALGHVFPGKHFLLLFAQFHYH